MRDWRFRTTWRGLLILQRRVSDVAVFGNSVKRVLKWRDATSKDLAEYYRDLQEKAAS